MAILLRAVRDFVNYKDSKEGTEQYAIAVDAAGWIFWDGKEEMTFRYICSTLDIDYRGMRKKISMLTKEDLLRMTPPDDAPEGEPESDED